MIKQKSDLMQIYDIGRNRMTTRTMDNCKLIKKYGKPDIDNGKCIGLSTENNDEPCEPCKKCKLNSNYEKIKRG